MFPPGATTAAPPLPPDVQSQMQQPPAASMFAQMGASSPGGPGGIDPPGLLMAQLSKLEQWLKDTSMITDQVNPALSTLLVPIAQAGKALASETIDLQQRMASPSPQIQGSAPPNVPGNIPGGRPAA